MYKLADIRSMGVFCIVGGFDPSIGNEQGMADAAQYAVKHFQKFSFSEPDFAEKPQALLTPSETNARRAVLQGLSTSAADGGYEAVAVFGSRLMLFAREAVGIACDAGRHVFIVGTPGSTLERYGKWFDRLSRSRAIAAYHEAERRNIMVPG